MDPFFMALGRTVAARWKAANFSLAAFPEIAQRALDEKPPSENVDLDALIKAFLLEDEQPFQTQSNFGQPELVVYDDPRFYIQILFWLEGTTEIHQHKFSGAFHVLAGSSLHSQFVLDEPAQISAHLRVGQLRVKETELLETGRTRPIISGKDYIHSLFHLETPSLTVVVRTHTDPGTGPQYTYLPPHLAVDPFYNDALTTRRKQLLDVLERLEDPTYPDVVIEMLADLDFARGFFILQNGMGYLRSLDRWAEAWEVFEKKHGALAKYVGPTLDEIIWRDSLVGLRGSVTDPEHRFFLALLLNVPTAAGILQVVEQRFPGAAVESILRWAEELSQSSAVATWVLDAEFPLEVSVPPSQQLAVFLGALRSFLVKEKGPLKVGTRALTAADLEHLRAAFAQSSLRALVA